LVHAGVLAEALVEELQQTPRTQRGAHQPGAVIVAERRSIQRTSTSSATPTGLGAVMNASIVRRSISTGR
jgi:hypothetical protein